MGRSAIAFHVPERNLVTDALIGERINQPIEQGGSIVTLDRVGEVCRTTC